MSRNTHRSQNSFQSVEASLRRELKRGGLIQLEETINPFSGSNVEVKQGKCLIFGNFET